MVRIVIVGLFAAFGLLLLIQGAMSGNYIMLIIGALLALGAERELKRVRATRAQAKLQGRPTVELKREA